MTTQLTGGWINANRREPNEPADWQVFIGQELELGSTHAVSVGTRNSQKRQTVRVRIATSGISSAGQPYAIGVVEEAAAETTDSELAARVATLDAHLATLMERVAGLESRIEALTARLDELHTTPPGPPDPDPDDDPCPF